MIVSFVFTMILAVVVIGSTTAYGVFVTLVNSGLLSSYIICIACKDTRSDLLLMATKELTTARRAAEASQTRNISALSI